MNKESINISVTKNIIKPGYTILKHKEVNDGLIIEYIEININNIYSPNRDDKRLRIDEQEYEAAILAFEEAIKQIRTPLTVGIKDE